MLGPFCLQLGSHLSWKLKIISGKVFYIFYLKHLHVIPFHFNWFTAARGNGVWLVVGCFSFCFCLFLKLNNNHSYYYYLYFCYCSLLTAVLCIPYCPVLSSKTHSLLTFPLIHKHWNFQEWWECQYTRAFTSPLISLFWACSVENYSRDRGPRKKIP